MLKKPPEPPEVTAGFAPQPEAPGDRVMTGGCDHTPCQGPVLCYGAPFPEGYEMCPYCHAATVNMNAPIKSATAGVIYRCEGCGKFSKVETPRS